MAWATHLIEKLKKGETVKCRPRGNSMTPKIKSGQLITIEPVTSESELKKNDIVMCIVKRSQYVHLISSIDRTKDRYQISNNHGRVNGWIGRDNIFGKVIDKE